MLLKEDHIDVTTNVDGKESSMSEKTPIRPDLVPNSRH